MNPVRTPITGQEDQGDLSQPFHALVQFYRAFNTRNIELMAETWAQSDEIVMDNPLGGIKRGWIEIQSVYEKLCNGPATVSVEFYDYTIYEAGELFCAVGRERGVFRLGGDHIKLAIRTTRVFRKLNGRWRQVHHHGSIDDPRSLERYQEAVLGAQRG